MRNLKRVLSLAMAAAMLIGMMVVSAGAVSTYEDFTDKDEIQNTEAVNTMVSLGVINGKDDGSYFDPNGIVTRAEMAALIARCLNGGIDPSLGTGAATTTFTDTKGHWAEAYIAYCANLGIINGKGDGTFGPDETVTGTAAAKMFLCALGYRSEIEGLTGAGWDLNTDSLANKTGLYDGLTGIRPSDGLNRDNTAQLVYNGVQANEVQYQNNYGEYSGVIYAQPNGTMLTNRFRVVKVEGIVQANDVFGLDGTPAPAGKTRITTTDVYRNNAGNYITSTDDYTVDVSNDMVGTRVVIYVQFKNALSPNAVGSVVVGQAISSEKNTIVETNTRLKDGDAVKAALRGSGLSIDKTVGAPASGQPDERVYEVAITEGDQTYAVSSNFGEVDLNGLNQRFIDNDGDSKVDLIITEKPVLSKVSSYNTKDEKLTLTGVKSIDFADIANYDEVAKDDYVLVAKYSDTYYLTVVEPVEGEVTAYNSGSHTLTVDGTNYAVSAGQDLTTLENFNGVKHGNDVAKLTAMVSNSYKLYLDKAGNMLAYDMVDETLGNYALVLASNDNSDILGSKSGKVKLLMADGTTGTYDVNLVASAPRCDGIKTGRSNAQRETAMAAMLHDGAMVNQIVTYSLDGSTVTLTKPEAFNTTRYGSGSVASNTNFASSVSRYAVTGGWSGNVMVDNSTIFFLRNPAGSTTETAVVTGLNNLPAKGLTAKGAASITYAIAANSSDSRTAKAVYVSITEAYTSSVSYAYVSGDYSKSVVDGEDIFTYPVVFEDGTTGTLSTKNDSAAKKNVYAYTTDSKGYVTFDQNDQTCNGVIVINTGNNTVDLENSNNEGVKIGSYPLSGSLKVWNVEDANDIFDDALADRTVSALVLDSDKYVRTAFVIEIRDGDMVAAPSTATVSFTDTTTTDVPALTVGGQNTLSGLSIADSQNYTLYNAAADDTVTVAVTPATGTQMKVQIDGSYVGGSGANTWVTSLDSIGLPATIGDRSRITITITLAPTDEDSDEVNRVITSVITVNTTPAADQESNVTPETVKPSFNGTPDLDDTFTNVPEEVNKGMEVEVDSGSKTITLDGTLDYADGFTSFSSNTADQKGNFAVFTFPRPEAMTTGGCKAVKVTKVNHATDPVTKTLSIDASGLSEDGDFNLVWKFGNGTYDALKVEITWSNNVKETWTINCSGLEFAPAPTPGGGGGGGGR